MLVSFSFGNFKCFKDESRISFVSGMPDEESEYSVPTPFGYSVLKTAAVYGANGSGKSKLFEAVAFLRDLVCPPRVNRNVPVRAYWKDRYDAFRLSAQSAERPSFFEAVFILDDIQYRYGVELDAGGILDEWLYRKKERETLVLSRKAVGKDGLETKIGKSCINGKIYGNVVAAGMVSRDVPLLTILATFNDFLSGKIVGMFGRMEIVSANEMTPPVNALANEDSKKEIVNFMRAFDFDIEDIAVHEISPDVIPGKIRGIVGEDALKGRLYEGVRTSHGLYDEFYNRVGTKHFIMETDESFGTNRLLRLSWPVLSALKNGRTLFIDEMDSGLHPFVVSAIVKLFYRTSNGAQLVVNTQNTSLLAYPVGYKKDSKEKNYLFRKDQIHVVNKNRYGEAKVYPVTYFRKNIRTNMEKMYLEGILTGVPYVETDDIAEAAGRG